MNFFGLTVGDGNGWDRGFWRFWRYATVIGGALWFLFNLRSDVQAVKGGVDSLNVKVDRVAADSMPRVVADRRWREVNEELEDINRLLKQRFRRIE